MFWQENSLGIIRYYVPKNDYPFDDDRVINKQLQPGYPFANIHINPNWSIDTLPHHHARSNFTNRHSNYKHTGHPCSDIDTFYAHSEEG